MINSGGLFEKKYRPLRVLIKSAALFWWCTLIFGFSSEEGAASSVRSGGILLRIVNVVAPSLNATMENYQSIPALENSERVLRKCAHMFEYAILALLLFLLIYEFSKVSCSIHMSGIITVIIGAFDEINQTRFEERYGSPVDVLIDAAGAAIMLLICWRSVNLLSHQKTDGTSEKENY